MNERTFQVTKNLLDTEYQRHLTYLQIAMASIFTMTISLVLFFLERSNRLTIAALATGMVAFIVANIYFRFQLKAVSRKIESL